MNAISDRWRLAVPLVNERTGERHVVVVELSDNERNDAIRLRPSGAEDEPWLPIINLYASSHALAGLSEDWTVPYHEIVRIRLH
jgi:hypothetical protein